MSFLQNKSCSACEGKSNALTKDETKKLLQEVPNWEPNDSHTAISCTLKCENFHEVMSAINGVACLANIENHHPDISLGYNYCHITFTTHAVNGLSENDFICASKINLLLNINVNSD